MKTYLYIGRYQPLHKNHVRILQKAIDDGGRLLVGLRITKQDKDNPFSYEQRRDMLREKFGNAVRTIPIPDPDCDLCVRIGRKVGYEVVLLEEETEEYLAKGMGPSGTKIREQMRKDGLL